MIEIKHLAKAFAVGKQKSYPIVKKMTFDTVGSCSIQSVTLVLTAQKAKWWGCSGPNGAGKTTTLRMLSTALKPDAGSILIDGHDVIHNPLEVRKRIGFLSADTGLYGRLTAKENIEYFARLHGMSETAISSRVEELFTLLSMHEFANRRADNMSTGMKQKTAIARAVVHSPELVVLDEPTTGLDIMTTQTVLDFIRSLKEQGTPVIFSTHHLDEVAALCDRVVVINQGISAFNGSLAEFSELATGQDLRQAFMAVLKKDAV